MKPVCLQIEINAEEEFRIREVVGKWKAHAPKSVKSCLDKNQGSGWTTEECFDLVERIVAERKNVSQLLRGWLYMGDLQDYCISTNDVELRNDTLEQIYLAILEVDHVSTQ